MNPTASHALRSTTCTNGLPRSFGPDGCPAVVDGSRRCGETKNLQIINEFKRLYEDKMKQIDDIAGGDCIQAKVNLQQEWIKDLTDQNEMLVRVVEELEVEAAERVTLLEKKLQQSAKSAGEKEDLVKEQEKRIKELEEQLKPFVENGKLPHDYAMLMREYKELEQEAGDSLQVALPKEFIKHEVPVYLRTFCSKSVPLHKEYVEKSVQTSRCTLNAKPNWMGVVNDIVERTEHEKTLIAALETECKNLVKQLSNKDKYIFDQNDLIVLLVQKLYIVYRTLRDLEDKTNVLVRSIKNPDDKKLDTITIQYKSIIVGLQKVVRKSIEKIEDEKCMDLKHRKLVK